MNYHANNAECCRDSAPRDVCNEMQAVVFMIETRPEDLDRIQHAREGDDAMDRLERQRREPMK